MKISIITLFPEVFNPILKTSILKRAQEKKLVEFEIINLRDFGGGVHQVVDGRPYGGGVGMILKADVLARAWKEAASSLKLVSSPKKGKPTSELTKNQPTILTSPSGIPLKQQRAKELSKFDHLIIVCGHYEGVDQRFIDKFVTEEISIGDFVLTGGEIPAMAITDAITRLIPGVLEKPEAVELESFSNYQLQTTNYKLLEYPHYTRPDQFAKDEVPEVLKSGNHQKIKEWRMEKALEKTKKVRPDLLKKV